MVHRVVAHRDGVSCDRVRAVDERRLIDRAPSRARGGRRCPADFAAEAVDWQSGGDDRMIQTLILRGIDPPYLIVRVVPSLFHLTVLPAHLSDEGSDRPCWTEERSPSSACSWAAAGSEEEGGLMANAEEVWTQLATRIPGSVGLPDVGEAR